MMKWMAGLTMMEQKHCNNLQRQVQPQMLGLAAAVSSVQHAMPRACFKGHMTFLLRLGQAQPTLRVVRDYKPLARPKIPPTLYVN